MPYRRKRYGKRRKYGMRRRVPTKKRVYRRKRVVRRIKSKRVRPSLSRKVNRISKTVNLLKMFDACTMGLKIYKKTASVGISSLVNQWAQAQYTWFHTTDYAALLSSLRVYNLVTNAWDQSSSADNKDIKSVYIVGGHNSLHIRNNNACASFVEVYLCLPRRATDRLPGSCYGDDCEDLSLGLVTDTTSPDFHPSFAPGLKQTYKCYKKFSGTLVPGIGRSFSHRIKKFKYNPGNFSATDDPFSARLRTFHWWIRVRGVMSFQTADYSKVGYATGSIEVININTMTVRYDAGRAITYQVNVNQLDGLGAQSTSRVVPAHSSCTTTYAP